MTILPLGLVRWRPASRMFLRVFGIFGGLLVAMTVVYGLLIIPLQQDSLLKVMYSQASTVSRSIIQACADAMLTEDSGFIVEHNLQVLQNNASIRRVVIVPRSGNTLQISTKGWATHPRDLADLPNSAFDTEGYGIVTDATGLQHYRYTTPIGFNGVYWGAIRVDFDTADYRTNMATMYRQLVLSSALALLLILPIGYFFALWLTRPMSDISQAAARVALGDLSARVSVSRSDEIGQLANNFNQMVEALEQNRARLQNYHQALERDVATRTHELDELNRTLDHRVRDEMAKRKEQEALLIQQSRLAAMGEMIGNIAHQWRQPLNALSLVIQNIHMQHRMGRLNDESMERLEGKANQLVARMSSTIDEFRNFFKPSKHSEPFNVLQALMSALDLMEGVFKNHTIEVTLKVDDDLTLFGVPGEFSQVVLNLLGNAKDALIDSGQVQPRVSISNALVNNRILIDIEDNGGGIDPQHLIKVFEPYFTTKTDGKGTGIGLYMSKMIVENNLGGSLSVINGAAGARFTLNLPAWSEKTEPSVSQLSEPRLVQPAESLQSDPDLDLEPR